jgi:hypothetical protein
MNNFQNIKATFKQLHLDHARILYAMNLAIDVSTETSNQKAFICINIEVTPRDSIDSLSLSINLASNSSGPSMADRLSSSQNLRRSRRGRRGSRRGSHTSDLGVSSASTPVPTSPTGYGATYNDPDFDPRLPCVGAILFLKRKELCVFKDFPPGTPIDSRSTNLLGKPRSKVLRDLGWGHPVVILRWEHDSENNLILEVANITSFDQEPFQTYIQKCKDFATGKDTAKTIKYANTLPIFHDEKTYSDEQLRDFFFLRTTGSRLTKQSYVALEGVYVVPSQYLRAYGVNYRDAWHVRLEEDSYLTLMNKLGEDPQRYESFEELLAKKRAINDDKAGLTESDIRARSRHLSEAGLEGEESISMTAITSSMGSASVTGSVPVLPPAASGHVIASATATVTSQGRVDFKLERAPAFRPNPSAQAFFPSKLPMGIASQRSDSVGPGSSTFEPQSDEMCRDESEADDGVD